MPKETALDDPVERKTAEVRAKGFSLGESGCVSDRRVRGGGWPNRYGGWPSDPFVLYFAVRTRHGMSQNDGTNYQKRITA